MTKKRKDKVPSTLNEAVEDILSEMSDEDKELVRGTPRDELFQFYRGWGMGIRNAYFWDKSNTELLRSCNSYEPDGASMVIIEAVWEKLQKDLH